MPTNRLEYAHREQRVTIDLIRSAPNQIKPFPRIEELCLLWEEKGHREVIDVGCGCLRNSLVLANHFSLWVCDFPEQLSRPTASRRLAELMTNPNFKGVIEAERLRDGNVEADAAVLAFVLHTLPEEQLRAELVRNTARNVRAPHEVFVAVPNGEYYYRQRMHEHNRFNDGHLFTIGQHRTFYREYSAKQIDAFMKGLGFEVDTVFPADKKNQRTYVMASRQ